MQKQKQIDVSIAEDGTVTIDMRGFQGKTCMKEIDELEKLLAIENPVRNLKPEFHSGLTQTTEGRANQRLCG